MRRISPALVSILLLFATVCRHTARKPEPLVIRMATILGRIMTPFSAALGKVLPEHYPARLEVHRIDKSGEYPHLIETGQIEVAMIQTDLAYVAYTQGLGDSPQPLRKLRGVAVLYTTPLHLLATSKSRIRSIADLRGKRVFAGAAGSPTEFTARMSLEAIGISLADLQIKRIPDDALAQSLRDGDLDAVFYRGNDPYPAIQEMMQVPGVAFIPISHSQIETIRAHH